MGANGTHIDSKATIHPKARLDEGVRIGPNSFIGPGVSIGKNTRIEANVFIEGPTDIGEENRFFPFSVIGTEPQDIFYKGEDTRLKIGNRNIFREFVTVNRGSPKGGGQTVVGSDNYFMISSHIAHDCHVGDEVIFMNSVGLAGHVFIDDFVTISAFTGIHQFCRVGKHSFIGAYSALSQDVLPYIRVAGSRPTRFYGINAVGLRRRGFKRDKINTLKKFIHIIFFSDLNTTQAVERIEKEFPPTEEREEILTFIKESQRGLIKKFGDKWE
ncbi:MAG: acyl-ACP--UDP-N-acetylglucosamine O-acyltransferase [Candidatus Aminicenantes bacterium]|nr:acyl-ACP--UDP-N-acetylglucosamine O-acyltransferase [Candidatus Aminicenantes bacterium]